MYNNNHNKSEKTLKLSLQTVAYAEFYLEDVIHL